MLGGKSAATYPVVNVSDSFLVVNPDVASSLGITIPAELNDAQKVSTSAAQ